MAKKPKGNSTKSEIPKRNGAEKISERDLSPRAALAVPPHHLGHLESERVSQLRRRPTRF